MSPGLALWSPLGGLAAPAGHGRWSAGLPATAWLPRRAGCSIERQDPREAAEWQRSAPGCEFRRGWSALDQLRLEQDAILAWAVRGWADYDRHGLTEPPAVTAATDAYHRDSDALTRFLEECCLTGPHYRVPTGQLWDRWTRWTAEEGADSGSQKALTQALDSRGYGHAKSGGQRFRTGLALTAEEDT